MRLAEWKKLQVHPVVLKAQEALKMAQQELAGDAFWKDRVGHLGIFPDPDRTTVLHLVVTEPAFVSFGESALSRRDILWDQIAAASPKEAKALVLAAIRTFDRVHKPSPPQG